MALGRILQLNPDLVHSIRLGPIFLPKSKGRPDLSERPEERELARSYFMPEVLLLLADLAFGSRLSRPSVADTATSDPSRRARTTGK